MKLTPSLAAGLFAIAATLSLNANAAADTAADTAANAKANKEQAAAPKRMKGHSHVQEKTGIPQNMPEAAPDKPNAAKDRSKHFHPRDGK